MFSKHVSEVPGTEFPAGRLTRVVIGPQCEIKARHMVLGHVTIYPGGSVPLHQHEQEEVYTVIAGEGEITVGGETRPVRPVSMTYIPSNQPHSLVNTGTADLVMLFAYSPAGIVDHWHEELEGKLK
jgi:mannose-6-phosphate isomerase-like protein (cupin superfamily)